MEIPIRIDCWNEEFKRCYDVHLWVKSNYGIAYLKPRDIEYGKDEQVCIHNQTKKENHQNSEAKINQKEL